MNKTPESLLHILTYIVLAHRTGPLLVGVGKSLFYEYAYQYSFFRISFHATLLFY